MLKLDSPLPTFIRLRLVQMLSALERMGGTPVDARTLHAFAFFANILSPLWDLNPLEGSVLKTGAGPYFPALQRELDGLVGAGLVIVVSLEVVVSDTASNRLEATYRLSNEVARPILMHARELPDESSTDEFLLELAAAFMEIRPDRRDDAATVDAAYSNPAIADGRVVDFAEWVSPTTDNAAWNVAERFQRYVPSGVTLSRAEKLVLYMRLMKRRAHG